MPELEELLERSAPRVTRDREAALDAVLSELSDEARAAAVRRKRRRRLNWAAGGIAGVLVLSGTTAAIAATPTGQQVVAQLSHSIAQPTSSNFTQNCSLTAAPAPGVNSSDPAVQRAVAEAQAWFDAHPSTEKWLIGSNGGGTFGDGGTPSDQQRLFAKAKADMEREAAARAAADAAREAAKAAGQTGPSLPPQLRSTLTAHGSNPDLVTTTSATRCRTVER